METNILIFAPIILVVICVLMSYKVFVTPAELETRLKEKRKLIENECKEIFTTKEEMQIERKKLLEAVSNIYLEKAVFEIAQRRIDDKLDNMDKRFDKQDEYSQHIVDLLLQKMSE